MRERRRRFDFGQALIVGVIAFALANWWAGQTGQAVLVGLFWFVFAGLVGG